MKKRLQQIPEETLFEERLKGARLMVYFRWVFISLISGLLILQMHHGYKGETKHSFFLLAVYIISNIILQTANSKRLDPVWMRYLSALLDVGIISFHLWHLSGRFDPIAVSAAATILLYPVMIILYTLRIDRNLLIFTTILSALAYALIFVLRYPLIADTGIESLSLTPLSHFFKSAYIIFIGMLCVFLQYRLLALIEDQTTITRRQTEADMLLQFEKERNNRIEELMQKEREMNKTLEREIAEKMEMASRLKQSKEQVDSIISNLIGAASRCLYDEHFTVKYYSDKIQDITGYSPNELIDNNVVSFAALIHDEDKEQIQKLIDESVQKKMPYSIEFRIIHKNGSIRWVHENGQAVFDENGLLLYLDGITTDISDRKEAEQSLEELTDFLPQTIYELDRNGYIVFANRAADELFGKGVPDESGNVHVSQFFPEDERVRMQKRSENFIPEPGKQYIVEATAIKKDGTLCPVLIYSTPMIRDGQLLGERGIIIDISERKKTEEELKSAKKELEKLNEALEKTIEERTAQLTEANTQLLSLQKENLQSQFDMLKQQVNPHFLFNSLNVLTSLIKLDPDMAESFTEQLAKVYRYVLENKDKDLVSVKTEMEFLRAYVFLLNIRFMGKVMIDIAFDEEKEERLLLPLSLQMLIENAIKHNTFSKKMPLRIRLYIDANNNLVVENNLQSRETGFASTGVGLQNIRNRYALLTDQKCLFEKTNTQFIARIPLLTN